MERKIFDPKEWLNIEKPVQQAPQEVPALHSSPSTVNDATSSTIDISEIESIVKSIEERKLDITASYAEWRNIGFALASGLGEGGRDYFHRVSSFHTKYSKRECDQQYNKCLKARGNGISMKSFFYYVKQAGIDISSKMDNMQGDNLKMKEESIWEMEDNKQGEMSKRQFAIGNGQEGMGNGELSIVNGELSMGDGQEEIDNRQLAISNGQGEDNKQVEIERQVESGDGGEESRTVQGLSVGLEENEPRLPTLPKGIYDKLPDFLQKVVAKAASNEEKDILLLGSLTAISACLPSFYGVYDGKKVFANLFLFVTAQASAGKGRLVHCKQLVQPIHYHLREQAKLLKNEYNVLLAEYNQGEGDERGEKPGKPPEKMLLIPANNSTTGVFQLLHDNEGRGMIFETEGDTLAQAFKSDYGNYSDGFRKAFHHETISYYRRTDREYVDIENPCVSTILSGTPRQVSSLIPNAENGLFSRFIFYYMNVQPVWKDVFSFSADNSLDEYFGKLGQEFYQLYKHMEEQDAIEFVLTDEQRAQFNQFFVQVQGTYLSLKGLDYLATVRRLGLIAFRMCMIFSALRIMEHGGIDNGQLAMSNRQMEENGQLAISNGQGMNNGQLAMGNKQIEDNRQVVCEDRDFESVLAITKVLVKHAARVYSELPEEEQLPKRKNRKERFFEALPKQFKRQRYLEVSRKLGISDKSAQLYIAEFCKNGLLHREGRDVYVNPCFKDI